MAENKAETNKNVKPTEKVRTFNGEVLKKVDKLAFINRKLIALNKKSDAVSKSNAVRVTQINHKTGGAN